MSRLYVGLHCLAHDASMCVYDSYQDRFYYIKFERMNNIKHYAANNFIEWVAYIKWLGFDSKDVKAVCSTIHEYDQFFLLVKDSKFINNPKLEEHKISHHLAHLLSQGTPSGLVYDGEGTDNECLSIYSDFNRKISYHNKTHFSLGLMYRDSYYDSGYENRSYITDSFHNFNPKAADIPGKVMAWEAYGEYLPKFQEFYKNLTLKDSENWRNLENFNAICHYFTDEKDPFKIQGSFIKNITIKVIQEIKQLLHFTIKSNDSFSFSGGVAQNLIINNALKEQFPNLQINAHNQDDGLSIGCLQYLLDTYGLNKKVELKDYPFCQEDENMGYATLPTIKKVAEYLAQGKIVLWCQGNGEIGPRALGNRSVLMDPGISDAKEQVNNRVKKREWYRPYAASVMLNKYQDYFDLPWESPYMLYQAKVKDPVKFKAITHADGTCRIQTVNPIQFSFHELLEEFEKLTGYPILLNTSLNLPGSPIVGRKEIALDMFKNSQADYLVIGDTIYERNNND